MYQRASKLKLSSPEGEWRKKQKRLRADGEAECSQCRKAKPLSEFYDRHGGYVCKKCRVEGKCASISTRLIAQLQRTGRKPGSTLTLEDAEALYTKQEGRCHYSGLPLTHAVPGCPQLVSIDRLDSSKPYTPSNCVLACYQVNMMKHTMSVDTFLFFCRAVARCSTK